MDKSTFINTRARLQRFKDMKFFAGWVKELTKDELLLKLSTPTELETGDQFSVEIHGMNGTATFKAVLTAQSHEETAFVVCEDIRFFNAKENVRLSTDMPGNIVVGGTDYAVTVVDISTNGAGLLSQQMIPRGTQLELRVDTPHGAVTCTAEVRYAKKDPDLPELFRLGLLTQIEGRVDRARWTKLFDLYAAA